MDLKKIYQFWDKMELKYPYKQILTFTFISLCILAVVYFLKRSLFSGELPQNIYGQGFMYLKFAVLVVFLIGIIFLFRTATSFMQKKNI